MGPALFAAIGPAIAVLSLLVQVIFFPRQVERGSYLLDELASVARIVPTAYLVGLVPALATGFMYGASLLVAPAALGKHWPIRAALAGTLGFTATWLFGFAPSAALSTGFPAGLVCGALVLLSQHALEKSASAA